MSPRPRDAAIAAARFQWEDGLTRLAEPASPAVKRARLHDLERTRDALRTQIADLGQPAVLEARARALGLVEPGERAFVVRGDLDPEPPPEPEHDGGRLGWLTGLF